jgi:hypothetical protein
MWAISSFRSSNVSPMRSACWYSSWVAPERGTSFVFPIPFDIVFSGHDLVSELKLHLVGSALVLYVVVAVVPERHRFQVDALKHDMGMRLVTPVVHDHDVRMVAHTEVFGEDLGALEELFGRHPVASLGRDLGVIERLLAAGCQGRWLFALPLDLS